MYPSWIQSYVLHGVDIQQFSCPENVRKVIAGQLGEDIVSPASRFESGYFKGKKACVGAK